MKWETLGRNHSCSQGPSAAASERPQKSPEELREKLRMVLHFQRLRSISELLGTSCKTSSHKPIFICGENRNALTQRKAEPKKPHQTTQAKVKLNFISAGATLWNVQAWLRKHQSFKKRAFAEQPVQNMD